MTYGLTTTGFSTPTFQNIRDQINQNLWNAFGVSLDLSDFSILGQMVAIIAEQLLSLWQLGEQVYSSQDVDKAVTAALDALCALTGTFRQLATSSSVTLTLTGTPTTVIPAGSQAVAPATTYRFAITSSATLATATAWVAATPYLVGARVTNASNIYQCTIAGTSAGAGGPTTTASAIVDNTVTWKFVGAGTGVADAVAYATQTGALTSVAGTITQIGTAVGGWSTVVNLVDAVPGRAIQTDEQLRVFRVEELAADGNSPADAIRAALLLLTDVISVTVFHNDTDVIDANNVLPHSVEALVRGRAADATADQAVWDTLLANVAAGIRTYSYPSTGTRIGTSLDTAGVAQTMQFSRPVLVQIYVTMNVTYDITQYPPNGDAAIAAAIVAFGNGLACGRDAVAASISAQAFQVAGVLDIPIIKIGTAPSPTGSGTVGISPRQLAVYDTSRIIIISTPGTP